MTIDKIDKRILASLQRDCTLAVTSLADDVGISHTACWRRIQKLEQNGYIKGRVALLSREQLNINVTVFIAVKTREHNLKWSELFKNSLLDIPEIVDIYRISGEIDYLIKAYVPDIASYDALYKKIISRVDIFDVTSMFAMEELKATTSVPLEYV